MTNVIWNLAPKELKVDPKIVVSKKCLDYIETWPFMVIILHNLDIFV